MPHIVVYVLESERDKTFYVGLSADVQQRLKRHNYGLVRSTKSRKPLRIVGTQTFDTFAEARAAEVRLKRFKNPDRIRAWLDRGNVTGRGSAW